MAGMRMTNGSAPNDIFNNIAISYGMFETIVDGVGGNNIDAGSNIKSTSTNGFFVDPTNKDFHPSVASAALDAGVASYQGSSAPALDRDGKARPIGAFVDAGAYEYGTPATDGTPPSERAEGRGKIGAALGVAFVLGPALGGLFANIDPKAPFYAVSVLAGVNFVLAWLLLPETRLTTDQRPQMRELLHSLVPTPIRMLAMVHDRRVGLYLYLWFHIYVAFAAVEGSFPLYLLRRYDATSLQVGVLFAWIGIFIAITQGLMVGRLARYVSEASMVTIGLAITAIGLMAITWAPSQGWLWLVGPVVAIGNGIAFPSFTSLYSQTCETRDAGELLGQGNSMGVAGRVVGALAAGLLMDRFSLDTPFLVAGVFMLSAVVIFGAAHRLLVPKPPIQNGAIPER